MHGRQFRLGFVMAIATAWLILPTSAQQPAQIPTPEQHFGFPMGADRRLAHWDDMVDYYRMVADGSDRIVVEELGKTTMGHPYLLAVVSTPDTIRDLPRFKAMQKQLSDTRRTSVEAADVIVASGKAVVLIGANVHSNEIGTSQMMNNLVFQLATERSSWVNNVLENTIVLLIPSQNPDGQRMVVDWYRRNLGTQYEGSPLPELYHKYAGHDNNRDSYMLTQVETQYLNRVMYQEWLPEVYLDAHQMTSSHARIFVPPFDDPANPNVDPLVWNQVNMLGQAMAAKLHDLDKPGVIWGELYSGYWQGANNSNPWWHNMVALLTEVASANIASPVRQERAFRSKGSQSETGALDARRGPKLPLAAPTDTQSRINYPRPWMGGKWTLADVVEYSQLATQGLLESVANNRITLKRNFYDMNRRTVERFTKGSPFAFVIPAEQPDPAAVTKIVQLLQAEAAEVHRAEASFVADENIYPAGTYVVRLDQPFGRWVKDVLEPQSRPDVPGADPAVPFERPYDITGWSLGMLTGVETVQIEVPFEAPLTLLLEDPLPPPGRVIRDGQTYLLSHESNRSFVALNRLLALGAEVGWARQPFEINGTSFPPGVMLVEGIGREQLQLLADDLRLDFVGTDLIADVDVPVLSIASSRIAVYEPWGGNMDAGWTRWVLEQHEFPYVQVRNLDIRLPRLLDRFDVIILPEMPTFDLLRGQQARNVRPEYRGGIDIDGIQNLRRFIEQGGTLITLGNSSDFATQYLSVELTNVLQDESKNTFYAPGTILRVAIDTTHPIGYGMPGEADVMFVNNGGFVPSTRRAAAIAPKQIVRYANMNLLRSGWMIGEEHLRGKGAVIEAPFGDGRVILHTFRVQHRGQTWGTFKLLFNSIFYGPAVRGQTAPRTSLGATQ